MVQFTHNIKTIKGASHKNGDIDGTCKRGLIITESYLQCNSTQLLVMWLSHSLSLSLSRCESSLIVHIPRASWAAHKMSFVSIFSFENINSTKGLFTRNVNVKVPVKVKHCANGEG